MPNVMGYLVAALVGAAISWGVQDWRKGEEIQTIRLQWQHERTKELDDIINKERKARDERDALARKIVENDQRHLDQLRVQENESKKLMDCVASGKCGLRIAATCPKQPGGSAGVPTPGTTVGVDTGTDARLTAAAEQSYYALRAGLNEMQTKLRACQADLLLRTAE